MHPMTPTVSPLAIQRRSEQGERIHLVDVRTPEEYMDGHALGAVSEPLDGLEAKRLTMLLGEGAGTRETLHLICESGRRAEQAAEKLRDQGLDNLAVVDHGTLGWAACNLPVQRHTERLSLERQTQIALGVLILLMLAKGTLLHPLFFGLVGLIGVGLIIAGATARCGLSALLARMPWNRLHADQPSSA